MSIPCRNPPRVVRVPVVLHLPAETSMVSLALELTEMAMRLGGRWEYRADPPDEYPAFHIYSENTEEVHS